MVWYPRHKPKLKENFIGVVYTFIQSAIKYITEISKMLNRFKQPYGMAYIISQIIKHGMNTYPLISDRCLLK